jgi:hypothetical protein
MITNQHLQDEFFELIKASYPSLTERQIEEITSFPFFKARESMESGTFPVIKLKYFGNFLVYPKKAVGVLKNLKKALAKGRIGQEEYDLKSTRIINYFKKIGYDYQED